MMGEDNRLMEHATHSFHTNSQSIACLSIALQSLLNTVAITKPRKILYHSVAQR